MLKTIELTAMRNNLHFGFHRDVALRLAEEGTAKLKVASLYPEYMQALFELDVVIVKIRKSALTESLVILDSSRDRIISSFSRAIGSALLHYSLEVVEAAKRIDILLKTYGKISRKPYNEQTSFTDNIIADLKSDKYISDVILIGTEGLVDELKALNDEFKEIMALRDTERRSAKTEDTRVARAKVDGIYRKICSAVNLFAYTDGPADFEDFIDIHNIILDRYKREMMQAKPRKKKNGEVGDAADIED